MFPLKDWTALKVGMFVELPCGCAGKIEVVTEAIFILRHWAIHAFEAEMLDHCHPLDEKFNTSNSGPFFPMKEATPPEWFVKREEERWID